MERIKDASVQLIVTSPPYWQLKDYGGSSQIGFNDSYQDYINYLGLVWQECRRVLENGCRLCVNIGDQFARAVYYGRYKVISIKTEVIKCCEALGFDYMGAIIWQKTITSNSTGGGAVMGSYPYPRNGIVKIDYESILIFKKIGKTLGKRIDPHVRKASKLTAEEWNTYFSGHWNFPGVRQNGHIAMFPIELPNRLIKMFSFVGDTVLDPFAGSGTTTLSAANLGRNSIGYEINGDYKQLISQKLSRTGNMLTGPANIEFLQDASIPNSQELRKRISALPYIFSDPVNMERKTDPKKFQFGSVVDYKGSGGARNDFYYVQSIYTPIKLLLNNGLTIRLLGIEPLKGREVQSVSFLWQKVGGQKVFLRFDEQKHDSEGNQLCYLYLSNKTFVNAHLIKSGYAIADREIEHRHLNRFIKYEEECNAERMDS